MRRLPALTFGLSFHVPGAPPHPGTPGTIDIHHIYTGRCNAAFVQFPDGTTLLIDAGAIPESTSPALGPVTIDASKTAAYKLTELTDVAELLPIAKLFDRGNTPPPLPSPMLANYREAGRADQIVPLHGDHFQVPIVAVNGRICTGVANQARSLFPPDW